MNSNIQPDLNKCEGYKTKKKKSRIQIVRTIIQAIATFLMSYGAYIFGETNGKVLVPVFQCVYDGSRTADGICKTLTKLSRGIPKLNGSAFIYMIIMIISILLIGKIWCGYLCPFGFFQDILTIIRKKLRIAPIVVPQTAKPLVKLLKWLILLCIIFGIGFCKLCPVKFIMLPLAGSSVKFSLLGVIIAGFTVGICFMKESAFCEVCPLGTIMGLLNKVSGARIKKKGCACTHCRVCMEVCPMGIEGVYQLRNNPDVTHPDCIFCMKCIEACPEEGALSLTILGKEIITSKRGVEKWKAE